MFFLVLKHVVILGIFISVVMLHLAFHVFIFIWLNVRSQW